MEKTKKINILWTGGWDSTYRIVELSFLDVTVQPIYVIDETRVSKDKELAAMRKILKMLREKKKTKAVFLPIKKVRLENIPKNEEISDAYKRIADATDLGVQHDWLARLALKYPDMEICIEKGIGDHTPVRDAIYQDGKLIKVEQGERLDKKRSTKDLNLVFGNFIFPIFQITEQEMVKNIKKWKYEDVMSNIWFCHNPIHDKPCGMCNPCCTKASYGMNFLLPKDAQLRNKRYKKIKSKYGVKMANLYRRIARRMA